MKKEKIGSWIAIIMLALGVLFPFAKVFGIKIPKPVAISTLLFVAVIFIWFFSAGLAKDFNISLPKGIIAFIYLIFGFFGGSFIIGAYFGIETVFIFVAANVIVFYVIAKCYG